MKAVFFAFFCALAFEGCGDIAVGDPAYNDTFNETFRYYYVEECRYDSFGPYDCEGIYSLSSLMRVSLRVEFDGFAKLNLGGDLFTYYRDDYSYGYDSNVGSYYYQFYETDGEITIYEDGYSMIYIDTYAGRAYYYYSSL